MKSVICLLLILLSCVSCSSQVVKFGNKEISNQQVDILSTLTLKNQQYNSVEFKVIHLYNVDENGYRIDSTNRVELVSNTKIITSILLPIVDEDIKNFAVTSIEETNTGFKIIVDWGGGNNYYSREFYFVFKGNQFYLSQIMMISYVQEPERTNRILKTIIPQISIAKFNLLDYLENEP